MRIHNYILILSFSFLMLFSCNKEENGKLYDGRIRFECKGIKSNYFVSAIVGDEQWCYSDTDLFYEHFAMVWSGFFTDEDTVILNGQKPSVYSIIMGLGGLGLQEDGTIAPPAPQFVFLETPHFTGEAKEFVLENIFEGAELDINRTIKSDEGYNENAFSINLYTQYYTNSYPYYRDVVTFRSGTGMQDQGTAYARVTEFSLNKTGTYDVTIEFNCKLYDNGRFFREIKEGIMRFKLDLDKL